jgi:apolipoprotein N-acyltransferase
VDATGRLLAASDLEREETLLMEVPLLSEGSIYRTIGDVFAWGCALCVILFVIYGFAGRAERRPARRRRR